MISANGGGAGGARRGGLGFLGVLGVLGADDLAAGPVAVVQLPARRPPPRRNHPAGHGRWDIC